MSALRTVASAILIVLGALLIALWAVSGIVTRAVEDGTAVRGIAERAFEDPAIVAAVGRTMGDGAVDGLAERGVDLEAVGLDDALRTLLARVAESDAFRRAVIDQIDDVYDQISSQLTAALREPAPLVVGIDPSSYVNDQVDAIPLVGESLPELALADVPVELMDEPTFTRARTAYQVAEAADPWALWIGLALLAAGILVSHRRRWFVAKTALALAVVTGGLWLLLQMRGLAGTVALLPGGADGDLGTLLLRVVTEEAEPELRSRLLTVALWSLVGAVLFAAAGALTRPRRTGR